MSDGASESYILCEGYHDRAFWKGWLTHLGCNDPGPSLVRDPWDLPVRRGHFAFYSRSDRFIRVVPAGGRAELLPSARARLLQRGSKALSRLILTVDADVDANATETEGLAISDSAIQNLIREVDASASRKSLGHFVLDGGETELIVIRWETHDPPTETLPDRQTLERLVCAAITAVYPARGPALRAWLDSRPEPPPSDPKEFSWSHMAG
jgi:hypothetical protein